MTRKEIKGTAKECMRGARPGPLPVTLVFTLLTTGVSLVVPAILMMLIGWEQFYYLVEQGYGASEIVAAFYHYMGAAGSTAFVFENVLLWLYSAVMSFGYLCYILRISRRAEVSYGTLLTGFGIAGRVIALNVLLFLFIFLWSMLFLIPGIIASYRYSMALFILMDDPECGPLEAIRRSKSMMTGRKGALFVLDLSFFNWYLIYAAIAVAGALLLPDSTFVGSLITRILFAVLSLWVNPYVYSSRAVYYNTLLREPSGPRDSGVRF